MAEDDGALAAYIKLAPMTLAVEHPPGSLEIKQLYVLAPWHGKGVAASLMDWAIETARFEDAPALYLSVWSQKASGRSPSTGATASSWSAPRPSPSAGRPIEDPVMRLDLA